MDVRSATTVPELFRARVEDTPDAEAFRHPVGKSWERLTWRETERRVSAIACGLAALGLRREERCAIVAETSLAWILCDLGILCAGGATTTVYASSTAEECAFILSDAECVVAFVQDRAQLAKIRDRRAELPALRRVVVLEEAHAAGEDPDFVLSLAALERLGAEHRDAGPGRFEALVSGARPDHLATLVYTSGTTGRPKGVELLHRGWVAQAASVQQSGILDHGDALQYFWLPLAHVFGKMIGTAQLRIGFPTAVDGRVEKLVENLAVVKPTFVCAVPRVFEKVHARVLQGARDGGPLKQAIVRWALGAGARVSERRRQGRTIGPLLAAEAALADRLVFRKIRALFGGRLRFFVSGSAPLSREVGQLFESAGVPVLEGYGLTESAAATHVNLPWRPRLGTVGPALPGVEVKLAEDGEVLMRGPWIMRAYHRMPEATAEALEDGWLRTGDVGALDEEGHLILTDRKRDLIKTSGGKFVAPQELEGKLKALSPMVSQVLVHGDRRPHVTALVTLDPAALGAWARGKGLEGTPPEQLIERKELRAEVQAAVSALNAAMPIYSRIRRFTLLPQEFSEARGEVTASQKLKRKVIEERYRPALDAMYREPIKN